MDTDDQAPIACTLQAGDYRERLAWIAELARDGLLNASRDDLRLELSYAPKVVDRVREMVAKEQSCCAFVHFELAESDSGVRLTITAPERARDVADALFEQFVSTRVSATGTCPDASKRDAVLQSAQRALRDRLGIQHSTIQIDPDPTCDSAAHAAS